MCMLANVYICAYVCRYVCTCVCLGVCMSMHVCVQLPLEVRRRHLITGAEVPDCCKLCKVSAGKRAQVLCKSECY